MATSNNNNYIPISATGGFWSNCTWTRDVITLTFYNFCIAAGSSAPDTAMKLNQCFYKADPEVRQRQKNLIIKMQPYIHFAWDSGFMMVRLRVLILWVMTPRTLADSFYLHYHKDYAASYPRRPKPEKH